MEQKILLFRYDLPVGALAAIAVYVFLRDAVLSVILITDN